MKHSGVFSLGGKLAIVACVITMTAARHSALAAAPAVAEQTKPAHPFSKFKAEVKKELGEVEVEGTFTLASDSDGIRPLAEAVTIQIGDFSTTIPANSFKETWTGRLKFEGEVQEMDIEAKIKQLGNRSYKFEIELKAKDKVKDVESVPVSLIVGDDGGTTSAKVEKDLF